LGYRDDFTKGRFNLGRTDWGRYRLGPICPHAENSTAGNHLNLWIYYLYIPDYMHL